MGGFWGMGHVDLRDTLEPAGANLLAKACI